MKGTEYQRVAYHPTVGSDRDWAGMARFATHAPVATPPASYGQGTAPTNAAPSHRMTIIGASLLVLVLAVMGAIGYLRLQAVNTETVTAVASTVSAVSAAKLAVLEARLSEAPQLITQVAYPEHVSAAKLAVLEEGLSR